MIPCDECKRRLDDLVAGELDRRLAAEAHAHLDECADCARQMEELVATVALCRRVGIEEPPEEYHLALHRKLVASGAPPRPTRLGRLWSSASWRPLGWAMAGAAAVAALMIGVPRLRGERAVAATGIASVEPRAASGPVEPTFRVPARRLAVVKIDFVAEQPVDDVEFAVLLPDGLRFVSGGRELPDREFRWRGTLAQGSNDIPVAVRGRHAGRYRIEARAAGGGVEAKHEVVLEVTEG